MSEERNDADGTIERAARLLAAPERFGDDFEQSLVEAIRADRPLMEPISRRPRRFTPAWWSAPMPLRLSPIVGLAMAAGLVGIAIVGTLGAAHRVPDVSVASASPVHDTVTFVRFVFVGRAKSVKLVGDFNQWGGEPTSLIEMANGAWSVSVPMSSGRHEYAFIVDGSEWMADPLAPATTDDFDTKSSIITVGT